MCYMSSLQSDVSKIEQQCFKRYKLFMISKKTFSAKKAEKKGRMLDSFQGLYRKKYGWAILITSGIESGSMTTMIGARTDPTLPSMEEEPTAVVRT